MEIHPGDLQEIQLKDQLAIPLDLEIQLEFPPTTWTLRLKPPQAAS